MIEYSNDSRTDQRIIAPECYPKVALIGLWVDDTWAVSEIESDLSVRRQGDEGG